MSKGCCPGDPKPSLTPNKGEETETCCDLHPPTKCGPAKCPSCGGFGKPVGRITLGALVKPERRTQIPRGDEFCFCRSTTCDTVYFFPGEVLFHKADLSVRVGLKEPRDATVPVCYCFDWTSEKILAEIKETGKSTAVEQIKTQVKAGNCYCEVTNPQGSCCLGNVSQAVKQGFTKK